MSKEDNGGPAFPTNESNYQRDYADPGISIRDYFAAKVMQSICAGEGASMVANTDRRYDGTNWSEIVALNAYEFADAMLKERKK